MQDGPCPCQRYGRVLPDDCKEQMSPPLSDRNRFYPPSVLLSRLSLLLTISLCAGPTGNIYRRPKVLWVSTDEVIVNTRSLIDRQIITSRCRSRSVSTNTSGALCSTRKKSSRSPACTVIRREPENPPMRFTPNNEEIRSRIRKANRMNIPGSAVMMFQASSAEISAGNTTDLRS